MLAMVACEGGGMPREAFLDSVTFFPIYPS